MQSETPSVIFGIRRLILINSGMYAYSVFPIDQPLSICGQNNSGKSAAINALQFLFLADMRDMEFGKHESLQTRKFYFPGPGSYILAEIRLPGGPFVIGAAGTSAASQYALQHFVYQAEFDASAYHDAERTLPLSDLLQGLRAQGVTSFRLQPHELRNMLLGVPGEHRLDLTMIPLRGHQERYINAWITVFKNLLHMRNVNSQDLKQLLLHIFDIRLVASDIDFAQEYQRVNAEVVRLEDELSVLQRMRSHVEKILEQQERRQEIRGRLAAAYPLICRRLEAWYESDDATRARDAVRLAACEPERQELKRSAAIALASLKRVSGASGQMDSWLESMAAAEAEFELVQDQAELDADLVRLAAEYDEVVKAIGAGERADPELIEADLADCRLDIARAEAMLEHWERNTWGLLSSHFSTAELGAVFAVLNHELLELPLSGTNAVRVSDEAAVVAGVRAILARIEDGVFKGDGVEIPLQGLTSFAPQAFKDRGLLEDRKAALQRRLAALEADLKSARTMADLREERARIAALLQEKREFRDRYASYVVEREKLDANRVQVVELREEETRLEETLRQLHEEERQLDREMNRIRTARAARERERERLDALQQRVRPLPPGEPCGDAYVGDFPDALEEFMEEYTYDWRDKQDADYAIEAELEYIEMAGGGVYLREYEDDSIRTLQEAMRSMPQREELLRKAKRTAVAELGNSLKGLLDNYNRLVSEMDAFNAAINRRTISNLTRLEIRLEPNGRVMGAIEELVRSGQYGFLADKGKASEAAAYLYEWVSAQGRKLNLAHLFELCFVVFPHEGRELVYRNLDRIESHGTTVTIKALVNMHMMGQLLDESRLGECLIPYYLDEAASIDPRNQENLIEQGLSMGFVPILASVKPQPTASYCVKIGAEEDATGLVIDESAWVHIEKKAGGQPASASAVS